MQPDVEFPSRRCYTYARLALPTRRRRSPSRRSPPATGSTGVKEGFLHHDYPGIVRGGGSRGARVRLPELRSTARASPRRARPDRPTTRVPRRDHLPDRRGRTSMPIASAMWGTSYGGGHVLTVGAIDRRVQVRGVAGPDDQRLTQPHAPQHARQLREKRRAIGRGPPATSFCGGDRRWSKPSPTTTCSRVCLLSAPCNLDKHVTLHTMEMYAEYEPASIIERIARRPF